MERVAAMMSFDADAAALSERERRVFAPRLTDLSLLPRVHASFERRCAPCDAVSRRRKFLFVFAALFCPGVLVGRHLPRGARQRLSQLYPGLSPCRLSSGLADVMFEFTHYRDFRDEVSRLVDELASEFGASDDGRHMA